MKHLEDQLQEACVTWFRLQYPDVVIMAIPNGGKRNAIEAAKLKRTGTLAGVADLFVMRSKVENMERYMTIWHGLWIEMKVGKNRLTESQTDFMIITNIENYRYHVCRSFDDFKKVIEDYLGQR